MRSITLPVGFNWGNELQIKHKKKHSNHYDADNLHWAYTYNLGTLGLITQKNHSNRPMGVRGVWKETGKQNKPPEVLTKQMANKNPQITIINNQSNIITLHKIMAQ